MVVLNGRAVINDGARVGGDVVSSRRPQVAEGADVAGDTRRDVYGLEVGLLGGLALLWLAVSVSLLGLGLLLVLVAPRAAAAVETARSRRSGASALAGIVASIALPILAVLVMVTLVGIPLGLMTLGALALVYALGWVVGALTLGRAIVKERSLMIALPRRLGHPACAGPHSGYRRRSRWRPSSTAWGSPALLAGVPARRDDAGAEPRPEPQDRPEPEASKSEE